MFIRSIDLKNTICLLLKFRPSGINPEFMMECTLIAHQELGDKEFLVLMDQCNVEFFS